MYAKRAVMVNRNQYGEPVPGLHLDCECGRRIGLDEKDYLQDVPRRTRCECGVTYDQRGWIIARPEIA